jgi:hypothetical protein
LNKFNGTQNDTPEHHWIQLENSKNKKTVTNTSGKKNAGGQKKLWSLS